MSAITNCTLIESLSLNFLEGKNNITEEGIQNFCLLLPKCLRNLKISFNDYNPDPGVYGYNHLNLGNKVIEDISEAIQHIKHLTNLNICLKGGKFTDDGFKDLSKALKKCS